jgi:hypothetical protein
MPWCPPELRPLKIRRVKVNEPLLEETFSKLIGLTFSGTYMGTYQVPEAHRLDERRVHRGTIEIADKDMKRILKGIYDVVDTVTFWSGISFPTDHDTVWLWCLQPIENTCVGQMNRFHVTSVTFFKESEFRAEAEIRAEVIA